MWTIDVLLSRAFRLALAFALAIAAVATVTAILPGPDALYVGTDEGLARLPLTLPDEGP